MTTTIDPFSSVRINKSQPKNVSTNNENDPFSSVRIKQAEGFPFLKEVGRHTARTASRIAETIGGIPGDISSLIQSGVFAGLESLVGHKTSEEAKKAAKYQRAPTSGQLKEISQKITSGFTKPQGDIEKLSDEFAETAASLLGPIKFRKSLAVALGSTGAKKSAEILGVGEGGQEASKLGTMFFLSAINPKGAMNYATSQYDKAAQLSKGSSIKALPLKLKLNEMIKELSHGVTTPGKTSVIKPAKELLDKVNNGKILVKDLTEAKRNINTLMGDPTILKGERKLYKHLASIVDSGIKPYEKINPEFSKAYRPANEIYGAVMQGNKASKYISQVLGGKSVLGATLAEAALGHPEAIIPSLAGAAGIHGAARTVDFFQRLSKSPELRKYYRNVLIAAAKEDAPTIRTYAEKIEKLLENDHQ